MDNNIEFIKTTSNKYKTLTNKDPNTIYFLTDEESVVIQNVRFYSNKVVSTQLRLYVSASGNDSNDGLTKSTPMREVSTALNKYKMRDDIEINVGIGVYKGFNIDGKKIRILGEGYDNSQIKFTTEITGRNSDLFINMASIEISNNNNYGIFLDENCTLFIQSCLIKSNLIPKNFYGIYLGHYSKGFINNVVIENFKVGVYCAYLSYAYVANCMYFDKENDYAYKLEYGSRISEGQNNLGTNSKNCDISSEVYNTIVQFQMSNESIAKYDEINPIQMTSARDLLFFSGTLQLLKTPTLPQGIIDIFVPDFHKLIPSKIKIYGDSGVSMVISIENNKIKINELDVGNKPAPYKFYFNFHIMMVYNDPEYIY